ncbi:MAG: glutamate--tRNA ligase [Alphaproteobacteria bacterium]|nr:glutamate--tRNA ligase [Alphaproteobacteria bacterium]
MTTITRFPPSPTGFMHIGNARTALFNYLFARANKGQFVVRIEDTDRARHSDEAVQVIFNALEWMKLDYDNEPVSQYANRQRHIDVANELLAAGKAYKCYCTPEELEQMREDAKKEGRPVAYDRRWRDRDESEAPEGIEPVIRIKAPLDGSAVVDDEVQGQVTVDNKQLDDFILLRSDGVPTYMLAVVVDDHDMGVTHVIRGDDHLNNTFRQNIIYDALEWNKPVYAHCPLIHGTDGSKFSKRHGSVSVEDYKKEGYLPEAFCNYLLRLGWGHKDEEIIPMDKAIELFSLKGINKAASKFDIKKLENLNAHYIKEADNHRLIDLISPFLKDRHNIIISELGLQRLDAGMDALKDRAKTLVQLADESKFYLVDTPLTFDEGAQKHLTPDSKALLQSMLDTFKDMDGFVHDEIEHKCRNIAQLEADGKLGKVMMPLRAALTGTDKSPSLFEAAEILGQEETIKRLNHAIAYIGSNSVQ